MQITHYIPIQNITIPLKSPKDQLIISAISFTFYIILIISQSQSCFECNPSQLTAFSLNKSTLIKTSGSQPLKLSDMGSLINPSSATNLQARKGEQSF